MPFWKKTDEKSLEVGLNTTTTRQFRFRYGRNVTEQGRSRSPDTVPVQSITKEEGRSPDAFPFRSEKEAMKNTVIIKGYCHAEIRYLDTGYIITCDKSRNHNNYSVCALADKMIISGGGGEDSHYGSSSSVRLFNFTTQKWSKQPDLLDPRSNHASVLTRQKLFIMFGVRAKKDEIENYYQVVNVLDLSTRSWSAREDAPLMLINPSVAMVNQDIFVMNGSTSNLEISSKTLKYNIPSDKWVFCQDMPLEPDSYAVNSTVVYDNRIFTLMGKSFLVYNTQMDQWAILTSPLKTFHSCAMVLLKDTLLVMGGSERISSLSCPTDCLQSYDLRTKRWSVLEKTMPQSLTHHTAIVLPVRL